MLQQRCPDRGRAFRQNLGLSGVRGRLGDVMLALQEHTKGDFPMKKTKLASMLAVMGGLTLATGACSGACTAATCAPAADAAAGKTASDCAASGCEAKPCAAAGCQAKPCAAAPE